MSTTIDEKVVEMRFDNKQFESNVQTSLSTLGKLKEGLNFDGATQGLEQIGNATRGLDMSGLSSAVDTVKDRFSAMEVIAVTALANIANSAINTGKRMLSSLTIEPITDGFNEYELKMDSVQTIMAGTGADLDTVMQKLNELNTYADKTIYSFADMTSNIGKFTNAGVDLDTAVAAIQGVANVAAVSGANSNEASRAMYNFAQALSAGYVKLIDWKSIENANMATVEFKTQLLEAAVAAGTVEKTADGMYEVLTTNAKGDSMDDAISATMNFNDSLSYQWMTTEVLTSALGKYADETTEIGQKAFAAAQDVKTFTQLMDTLKEAVGSGWAETWEIIFGNFEEAKVLWTGVSNVIGGFIDSQSKARNELLSTWKDLGGRDVLIEGISNAFHGFLEVLKPIKEALSEVFPPLTGEQLLRFTEGFRDLTAKFKISDETAQNLKNTFRGLFSVFSLIGKTISSVLSGFEPLLHLFPDASGGIVSLTGSLGAFIDGIRTSADELGVFEEVTRRVSGVIQVLADFLGSFVDDTIVSFYEGGMGVTGVLEALFDTVANLVRLFFDLGSAITGIDLSETRDNVVRFIRNVRNSVIDFAGPAFDSLKEKVSGALETLKQVFSGFRDVDLSGVDSLTERIKLRFEPLGAIFDGVKKVFSGLWEFLKRLAPIFANIATAVGNALGSLGDALTNALGDADFETILDILNGGVLAGIGLGIKKFVDGISDITENAGGMLESVTDILDGVKGCFEAWQQSLKAGVLLKIAGAIAVLTASLVVLSMIDSDKLLMSLAAITAEFGLLMGSMSVMTKILDDKVLMNDLKKMAAAMLTMSAAVLVLSFAMKTVAELDWDGVFKGLVSVGALIAMLTLSAKELSKGSGKLIQGSASLLVFAFAIRALVGPVKELGALDISTLAKGLISIGVLMAELAAFLKLADFDGIGVGKGLGLVLVAEALNIMAGAVAKIGAIDTVDLVKGLLGMAGVLAEIAIFTQMMGSAKHVISTAVGLTIMGAAMLIFSKAIENMGSLSLEQIGKGLLTMGVALAEITLAMQFMPKSTILIGAGLVVVGAALNIIAMAMKNMAGMTWEEIAKGLVALAGSLVIIAVGLTAMIAALPGAAAMVVFSAALALFVPILKLMAGMTWGEIAKGLITLAAAFAIIGVAGLVLTPVIPMLLGLSAAIALLGVGLAATGAAILLFATALSALAVAGAAGASALVLIITSIAGTIPVIVKKIGEAIVEFCKAIASGTPAVVEAAVTIVKAVMNGLVEAVPTIVETVVVLIVAVLGTLAEHMPEIVESGIQILLAIQEGIENHIDEIVDTAVNIVVNLIEGISKKIPDIIQCGWDVIINFINGLANGIETNTPRMIEAIENLGRAILNAFLSFFGIHSPSTVMREQGGNVVQGAIDGITGKFQAARDAIRDLGDIMLNKIGEYRDLFLSAGSNVIDGLVNGVKGCIGSVATAATTVGKTLLNGVKDFLGIESPSKEMAELGMYSDDGLAGGLRRFAGRVADAARDVGETALDSMSDAVSGIGAFIADDFPENPVIRPVLDLSNIEDGAGQISSMLDANRTFKMAEYNDQMATARRSGMNDSPEIRVDVDNGDIVTAVDKLRDDFSTMVEVISHLKVVLNNGVVAGELAPELNTLLGTMMARERRQ